MKAEHIKIIASFVTPIVILILGIWAKGIATDHERRVSLNDRIIVKRINVYENIGKDLNDIYVFLIQVGDWKKFSPKDIIKKKRNIDKVMYVNRPYWSDATFMKYRTFMKASFETETGIAEDAKIRTFTRQFKALKQWESSWEGYFSEEEPDLNSVKVKYIDLMKTFSEEFGFIQSVK